MATKLENLKLEKAHFEKIKKYIPDYETLSEEQWAYILNLSIVEVSTVFEVTLANVKNCEVVSTNEADLSCGADAKLSTVRTHRRGLSYGAPITGVHNKTGNLLCQVYERKQRNFYYFKIPHKDYGHIPKTSNIEIPFELDGTPRKVNKCRFNPWKRQVNSFEELCA